MAHLSELAVRKFGLGGEKRVAVAIRVWWRFVFDSVAVCETQHGKRTFTSG